MNDMFKPIGKKQRQSKAEGMKGKPDKTTHVLGASIHKRKQPEKWPDEQKGLNQEKRGRGRPVGSLNHRRGQVTLTELKDQASVMIRKLYKHMDTEAFQYTKNTTAAWANVVDKWAMLSGRPTEIIGHVEVEKQRPGLVKLASRIASSREKEPA